METFEHFEEQKRSFSYLDELSEKLARDAADRLAEQPDASIAGLVLEARTPEVENLWTLVEQATGGKIAGGRCAGLIPKELAVEILRLNAGPEALRWLEQNAVAGRLPILVSMEHGFRMGVVEIPRTWD